MANVRRQVSLAGGKGESQGMGVKALGLLCSSQALCLNAESRQPSLESGDGQRLAERPCSAVFIFASIFVWMIPDLNTRAIFLGLCLILAILLSQRKNQYSYSDKGHSKKRHCSIRNVTLPKNSKDSNADKPSDNDASGRSAPDPKSHVSKEAHIVLPNVRHHRSPPAFGADPAAAGCVTKVPKAW